MDSLSQVMFKFTNYVMMFAPIGVGAAMAHTVATQGLGVLVNLGKLILLAVLALVIFVVVVFGLVIRYRAGSVATICARRARAGYARIRNHQQRIGVAESDGIDGTSGRAATHRRFRYADRLLVQSRRLDTVSGDGFGVRGAGRRTTIGRHMDGPSDRDDADADDYFKRCGGGAARVAGYFARHAQQLSAGRPRADRRGGDLRRG